MSMQSYVAHTENELAGLDLMIRRAENERDTCSPERRVELAGQLAVLTHRRARLRERLCRERQAAPGVLQELKAELDQDLDAFAGFVEREILRY